MSELKATEANKINEPKQKQKKVSVSYTLKACKKNNDKLLYAGVITNAEWSKLETIRENALKQWINKEYGF